MLIINLEAAIPSCLFDNIELCNWNWREMQQQPLALHKLHAYKGRLYYFLQFSCQELNCNLLTISVIVASSNIRGTHSQHCCTQPVTN